MNLAAYFLEAAAARPDAIAIRSARREITFRELVHASGHVAKYMQKQGLAPGDHVLVLVPVSIALYIALLAIFRAGLVAVFVDPSAGIEPLTKALKRVPPQAMIGGWKAIFLRGFLPALRKIPLAIPLRRALCGSPDMSDASLLVPCEGDTPALITFTSGSTGEPKAAVRSHAFLEAQWRVMARTLNHRAGEVDLATLPVFVLANLASGLSTLLPDADLRRPGFITPGPVIAQIRTAKPATTAASPAFLERLVSSASGEDLTCFKAIFTGGAPVFPSLLEKLQHLAPQAQVVAVYGSTEAEPIAEIPFQQMTPEDLAAMRQGQGLLTGKPVAEIALCLLEDHWGNPLGPFDSRAFQTMHLPPGAIGEIVVSGHHVLPGYLDGVGDTETKIAVAGSTTTVWHRTGDLGRLDEQGRLWLLGRCAAVVRDENGVLYPFAVEVAAMQLPGVQRAALAPGRRVLAIEGDADLHQIQATLAWASLNEVVRLKKIPLDRRHNAKVDYPALIRQLAKGTRA